MDVPIGKSRQALCGANLRAGGQNARLRMGIIMLTVALLLSVVLVRADVSKAWRALLFVPFFMASMGAWQGLYRTCPMMVRHGRRETEDGEVRVADPEQVRGARKLAFRVLLGSVCTALLSTALVTALP